MTNKKKIIAAGGVTLAAAAIIVGTSLALFSDTDNNSAVAKAGTLDIAISDAVLTNNMNINPGDNDPKTPTTYKPTPGNPQYDPDNPDKEIEVSTTEHILSYRVNSLGSKSAKTRQTIVISAKDAAGNPIDASVFALYEDKNGNGRADEGEELEVKTIEESTAFVKDGNAVVYRTTTDTFDGINTNGEKDAEIEEDTTAKYNEEDNSCYADYSYLFGMSRLADNTYQAADITIEIVVEAMQYRNTEESDWNIVSTKRLVSAVSGVDLSVVPRADQ